MQFLLDSYEAVARWLHGAGTIEFFAVVSCALVFVWIVCREIAEFRRNMAIDRRALRRSARNAKSLAEEWYPRASS